MALCPFAVKKLIPAGENDPVLDVVYGAILHVAVTNAESLHDYFDGPSGGVESHFHIDLDGQIEQYRDTGREADANNEANSFTVDRSRRAGFVSIETAGMGEGTWNAKQLASIKRLLVWLAETHDFPLAPCPGPFKKGVGYHTMWGAPSEWTPVAKTCPGPERIKQFKTTLTPWMADRRRPQPAPTRVQEARQDLREAADALQEAVETGGRGAPVQRGLGRLREVLRNLPKR